MRKIGFLPITILRLCNPPIKEQAVLVTFSLGRLHLIIINALHELPQTVQLMDILQLDPNPFLSARISNWGLLGGVDSSVDLVDFLMLLTISLQCAGFVIHSCLRTVHSDSYEWGLRR